MICVDVCRHSAGQGSYGASVGYSRIRRLEEFKSTRRISVKKGRKGKVRHELISRLQGKDERTPLLWG